MSLAPGGRVDRYVVRELLGRGGMGEVYRVCDPRLERDLALKIVKPGGALAGDGGPRLLREARAAAALSHPNVLAVFDVGEVREPEALRGLAYIAMELVVGRPLRAFVGDASVPLERRLSWLRDVARALAAAHDAGLVHRDVKPENVMIRSDGAVKVLDFGIARRAPRPPPVTTTNGQSLNLGGSEPPVSGLSATMTAQQVAIGTPIYMAPEQLRAEPLDGRADQFAWGVVAYELLTGRLPWDSSDAIALVSTILSREPPSPAAVDPRIPADVSAAILRALAKEPALRFASMHELALSLERRETGRSPVSWSSVSPVAESTLVPSVPRTVRPRRWRAAGMAPLGALILGALAALALGAKRGPRAAAPGQAAAAAGETPQCTSSAQCSREHGGEAWHCNTTHHECVPIASEDCRVSAEPSDLARDDTVWLGGLFPLTGGAATDVAAETRAVELARRDFAGALGANAPRSGELHARPIATVICDEAGNPERAARHLAEDVEVPAVLGFRWTATGRRTIPTTFLPAGTLSFVTISEGPDLTRIPEPKAAPRLVWRSTLDALALAAPLAAVVSDVLEPRMRARAKNGRPFRVAIARDDGHPHTVVEELFRELRFNGKSALENSDDFRQFVFDEARDGGADGAVDALADFAPDVIVVQSSDGVVARLVEPLERKWTAAHRPTYLTSSYFGPDVAGFAGKDASRRGRFLGVTNVATTMPNGQLVLHYNAAFPDAPPVTRTVSPQPSYDAFYTLALAAQATGGEGAVTGAALSRAITRLEPPGRSVDVGPSGILDAFEVLRSGGNVDLRGAIGSLDFDPATGEAPIDLAVVCPGLDDHGRASDWVESGLVYEAKTRTLRGTMAKCP